ncbi:hypothetical protein DNTS_031413 [Danionella cerebrum]|uniref:Uncharacterized protein n=1 Tax=Danionella cerebrum TaxID=2873325 RepID=A0A553MW56_9TELE|nr:hypothetical protein DNTS_031413 [Danionella translucida]
MAEASAVKETVFSQDTSSSDQFLDISECTSKYRILPGDRTEEEFLPLTLWPFPEPLRFLKEEDPDLPSHSPEKHQA